MMSELQAFLAMLERAGVGHGTRQDHDPAAVLGGEMRPERTAVLVEPAIDCDDDAQLVMDWRFDADGNLVRVLVYD
jgi:hypothetical protein